MDIAFFGKPVPLAGQRKPPTASRITKLLQPNNVIASTQVADVRVESRGRGAQGEAQTVGWLSRFFLNFHPF